MTLEEAIAEVKRATSYGPWQVGDIGGQAHNPLAHEIVRVLQAVASGDLTPRTDAERAVAVVVQKAADYVNGCQPGIDPRGWRHVRLSSILALAPAEPLAEVERMRAERDHGYRLLANADRDAARATLTTPEKDTP